MNERDVQNTKLAKKERKLWRTLIFYVEKRAQIIIYLKNYNVKTETKSKVANVTSSNKRKEVVETYD